MNTIIKYKHIKIIQNKIGNGITLPRYATTDDNDFVLFKAFGNPEGPIVLFNEYLCYRLAIMLGIPMPVSGICLVDDKTINHIDDEDDDMNFNGYGFYSTFVPKVATLVEDIVPCISNKEDFYKILLFDHVVFNQDRNEGNLLVKFEKSNIKLYAIDHTHVFVNQALWNSISLEQGIEAKDYLNKNILNYNQELYKMFFSHLPVNYRILKEISLIFENKITESFIKGILNDMPTIWFPKDKDIETMIKYIMYRIEHLDEICKQISKFSY